VVEVGFATVDHSDIRGELNHSDGQAEKLTQPGVGPLTALRVALNPAHRALRLPDSVAAYLTVALFGCCLLTATHTLTMASENLSGEVE
jgi:hypothetical protein